MASQLEEILSQMQIELASQLLTRIKSGEFKPADAECARKLLLDNDIQALPQANPSLMKLADALPFDGSEAEAV